MWGVGGGQGRKMRDGGSERDLADVDTLHWLTPLCGCLAVCVCVWIRDSETVLRLRSTSSQPGLADAHTPGLQLQDRFKALLRRSSVDVFPPQSQPGNPRICC